MYSQPTALRMDLFSSTSGIPPSSVPAGQISLQKYGAPCPMISTTNMGSMITNTRKITYFSFRRSLSPPKCPNLLWKRNLVQQILDQSKGAEKSAHQSSKQRSHKDQKSSYIICHFEVPASDHSLKRTNGAGPSCPGAGIAVQPRNTYIFQFSGIDLASYKP